MGVLMPSKVRAGRGFALSGSCANPQIVARVSQCDRGWLLLGLASTILNCRGSLRVPRERHAQWMPMGFVSDLGTPASAVQDSRYARHLQFDKPRRTQGMTEETAR